MTGKEEVELRERQPLWPAWPSWVLSIAGTPILAFAALSGGTAILFWRLESECPEAIADCVYVVRRPGLLFLGISALVSVAVTLRKMVRAMRKRGVQEIRIVLVLLSVTLALALSILGVPFLDALFDDPYFPPSGG